MAVDDDKVMTLTSNSPAIASRMRKDRRCILFHFTVNGNLLHECLAEYIYRPHPIESRKWAGLLFAVFLSPQSCM